MLSPIASGHVVEAQRRARVLGLRDQRLGSFALLPLYGFGFPSGGLLRRAEKATTVDLEVECVERRPLVASDRHGDSFRVWFLMKASRSGSANMRRVRFLPLPMLT